MSGNAWCPHCGGQSGYLTTQRRRVSRLYTWEGSSEDVDNEEVIGETLPRCFDCNKIIRLPAPSSTQQGDEK